MLLMWLGELVTEQSLGNGISLIITVGIVSRLPANIESIMGSVIDGKYHWKIFDHSVALNRAGLIYWHSNYRLDWNTDMVSGNVQ